MSSSILHSLFRGRFIGGVLWVLVVFLVILWFEWFLCWGFSGFSWFSLGFTLLFGEPYGSAFGSEVACMLYTRNQSETTTMFLVLLKVNFFWPY